MTYRNGHESNGFSNGREQNGDESESTGDLATQQLMSNFRAQMLQTQMVLSMRQPHYQHPPQPQLSPQPQFFPSMSPPSVESKSGKERERKFHCRHCPDKFLTKHVRDQHELRHSPDRPFHCNRCPFTARQKAVIWRHKKKLHPDEDSSVSMDALMVRAPTSNGRNHASNATHTAIAAQLPRENGHSAYVGHSNMATNGHLMKKQGGSSPSGFMKNRKKNRAPRRTAAPRRQHQASMFSNIVRRHKCGVCNRFFKSRSMLRAHELIHCTVMRYSCMRCGVKSACRAEMRRHCKEVHKTTKREYSDIYKTPPRKLVKRKNKSPICDPLSKESIYYKNTADMRAHFARSLRYGGPLDLSPPRNGTSTSQTFNTPIFPAAEAQPSTSRASFYPPASSAPTMPSSVPQMSNGNVDTHTAMQHAVMLNGNVGILQYDPPASKEEDEPERKFSSVGTPDQPHRCEVCGRCFRLNHVKEQHVLTHYKFRRYACNICGFRAKQKAVIYRHKKVKHPDSPGAGRVLTLTPGDVVNGAISIPAAQSLPPQPTPQQQHSALPSFQQASAHLTNQINSMAAASAANYQHYMQMYHFMQAMSSPHSMPMYPHVPNMYQNGLHAHPSPPPTAALSRPPPPTVATQSPIAHPQAQSRAPQRASNGNGVTSAATSSGGRQEMMPQQGSARGARSGRSRVNGAHETQTSNPRK